MVRWLCRHTPDVPPDDAWLSDAERATLATLRVPKRRADWRLGRWTAHQALEAAWPALRKQGPVHGAWSVRARPDGSPEALLDGVPSVLGLSISHCAGVAMAAVAPGGIEVGCDLEVVEPRAESFAQQFFTPRELGAVAAQPGARRDLALTLLWSAKESALKALRTGLREDTRAIEVAWSERGTGPQGWAGLSILAGDRVLSGVWRVEDGLVATLVAVPWQGLPVALDNTAARARAAS